MTATEIVLAFLLLGIFAVLSVAFGLAMSSKFASPTIAIMITLCVAAGTSVMLYLGGGLGLSYAAHELWPGVSGGPPVWLPTAYVRADFGLEYIAFLLLAPVALTAVPAWLFYEITIANMAAPSDDRSTRLRWWLLLSGPTVTATGILPGLATAELGWFVVGMMLIFTFYLFGAFLVAGEPLGPSHRVEVHWQRQQVGAVRRYLGPGVLKGASLLLWLGAGSLLALMGAGALVLRVSETQGLVALGAYALCFLVFVVGFGAWSRARASGAAVPRVLLLVALFLAVVGPWIAMAIAGVFGTSNEASVVAAPSPAYAFFMLNALTQGSHDQRVIVAAGLTSAVSWGLLGVGLLLIALGRVKRRVREERTLREALESSQAA